MKRVLTVFVIIVLLGLVAGATLVLDITEYAVTPLSGTSEKIDVVINPNQGFDDVLAMLADAGVGINKFKFECIARYKGYDKKIKAGEYVLAANMSPEDIFRMLISGKERLYRLTIPEGYTVTQIAGLIEQAGWPLADDFVRLAHDRDFIATLGIDAPSLEGYLFPETYHFPKRMTAEKMAAHMVKRFQAVFTPQWKKRAKDTGFTVHEIVTLASIIEKETGAAVERPVISSVFHNRLKKGMRLESDPTVIYGIPDFDGNITRKHLRTKTPYNTYRIKGLPPGPIANPGEAALYAALYPDDTDYLFFVAKKDGTHHFSTNVVAHNRAVRKYQLHR